MTWHALLGSAALLRRTLLRLLLQVFLAAFHRDGLLLVVLEHVVDCVQDLAILHALVKRLRLNPILELALTDVVLPILVKLLASLLQIILVLCQLADEELDSLQQLALRDCEALLPSLVARSVEDPRFPVLPARAHLQSLGVEVLNVPVEPSLWQRRPWVDLGAVPGAGGLGDEGPRRGTEVGRRVGYCLPVLRNAQGSCPKCQASNHDEADSR